MASDIKNNLDALRKTIPQGVDLVAVSKFHPAEIIMQAYEAGQRIFGESRIQELDAKAKELPQDIRWHFIGHLQTNKVKQLIAIKPALIESIDSCRLLDIVDNHALSQGFAAKVLLQVHVAQEDTKFGFLPDELLQYFRERRFEKLKSTHICGIMGMATNTDSVERITQDFTQIADLKKQILEIAPDLRGFNLISMGMSDDYSIAIDCGSNLVRIGTAIFGSRQY